MRLSHPDRLTLQLQLAQWSQVFMRGALWLGLLYLSILALHDFKGGIAAQRKG